MKNILIYTDIGRDVDDALALCYAAGHPDLNIIGVITTHMIPDRRAMIARALLDSLGLSGVPVGVGSIYPLGKGDDIIDKYLRNHSTDGYGSTYEGNGLIPRFQSATKMLHNLVAEYGKDLYVSVQAPMMDLAELGASLHRVAGIFIQGQATISPKTGRLLPDPSAYNIKEDETAAQVVFTAQGNVPFTMIGKHAAYKCQLGKESFQKFRDSGHVAGKYLCSHALAGLESFAQRSPDVFEKVIGKPSMRGISEWGPISNPYDALLPMAIAGYPFNYQEHRQHKLLGMTEETHGIDDAANVIEEIESTILKAFEE